MVVIPKQVKFILYLYALGIIFFLVFRIVLLLTNPEDVFSLPENERISLILRAFLMGFRFDTVVSGYLLCIPVLVLFLTGFFKREFRWIYLLMFYFTGTLYTAAFLAGSADIPFFKHYFSRLSTAVFNWGGENKFIFEMITGEKSYFIYFIFFLFISGTFWYIYVKYLKKVLLASSEYRPLRNAVYFLIFAPVLFIAIRGRIEAKSPIRVGTAYFSAYAFPNQLGLNPLFTFIRSYLDDISNKSQQLELLPDDKALTNTKTFFNQNGGSSYSFLSREYAVENPPLKANVILILMESMSAEKMRWFGSKKNLTPKLDSLAMVSYLFENFYTAGIHTYNGIFSTLYSYPALLRQHPMKVTVIPEMSGLPITLWKNGYSTVFFTTHDEQFDNMSGFMYANGFEKIVSQKDYPSELVAGATGVPDHIMFEHSIPVINSLNKSGKPFFAALLTASDHGPYYIPDYIPFRPKSKGIQDQIIEYADWSLYLFMKLASEQSWYRNTIFIFAADHGAALDPIYDMPLSFNHSPLLIHSPELLKEPKIFKDLCGQIDIFPTVMHLLRIPYVNHTMGINVFMEKRPYIFFSNDDKIGCVNDKYFLVVRMSGGESLYDYKAKSTIDEIHENASLAADMKNYAFSMMQTSQLVLRQLSSLQKSPVKEAFHSTR